MLIAGSAVGGERSIDVRNPYNGNLVGTVPRAGVDDLRRAFAIARAFRSPLTRHDRYRILHRAAEILRARADDVSDLITAESGLCKKDTRYEVGRACDVFVFAGNAALQDDGQVFSCDLTPHGRQRKVYTLREPLRGAISAITPFNHPLNQVAHKVAPSIATNNRMVLKPSEKTPLSALLLAEVLYDAGLPPEMFSVVTGDPREIADEMLVNPDVDLVTFTGGVPIGKHIAARAVYKRQVLELGGNDPIIVLEDADLDEAAALAAAGSYRNSGQRCTAVKRILVHEAVADRFVDLLLERTRAWTYGDPMDPDVDMGTVIDEAAAQSFAARVDEAVAQGARLLHGNVRRGALYSPTLVDHVSPDVPLVRHETFGPVSPVLRFRDLDDAIRIANSTDYGLSSAVCSNRLDHITRLIAELHVGTVNVREVPGYRLELTPFGGIKDSGLGYKEGVQEAMKSFTNVKTYSLPW
ncbi:MAG: phosphonoacetaldehyde dehydrogenase [Betaproteobacteria bacterium]|nr:phosphonoacetaldehyde dehydrogenase [Betaproteobacteria bacterium]MBK8687267.1 phosphonoacetaldehyde dehydrogenase [Betaproteobacteria bacterium]